MPIPLTVENSGSFGTGDLISLDKGTLHAVLATVSNGFPHTSLVSYAFDAEGHGMIFLTPRETAKYANIVRNPSVSMLIDTARHERTDYLAAEAYTITGKAVRVRKGSNRDRLLEVYLGKHPDLESFASAKSTAMIYVKIVKCTRSSSFQSISTWDPNAA